MNIPIYRDADPATPIPSTDRTTDVTVLHTYQVLTVRERPGNDGKWYQHPSTGKWWSLNDDQLDDAAGQAAEHIGPLTHIDIEHPFHIDLSIGDADLRERLRVVREVFERFQAASGQRQYGHYMVPPLSYRQPYTGEQLTKLRRGVATYLEEVGTVVDAIHPVWYLQRGKLQEGLARAAIIWRELLNKGIPIAPMVSLTYQDANEDGSRDPISVGAASRLGELAKWFEVDGVMLWQHPIDTWTDALQAAFDAFEEALGKGR